ncbi:MAG: UvrD-helicase domain-containing protein [Flavobacteriaceae bacterium]|nr:UvrD-helicase domain-containing protein [Flavobacteriaceae bacterium]
MNAQAPFLVYNASAGSGKTFILAKTFLVKIISETQKDYYKYLLAITFTNKAVAEMKQRVITSLIHFSLEEIPSASISLFSLVEQETRLTTAEIKKRSKQVLHHLLHHYGLFSIETIDHFNLRLLRTFARDLKLPSHFEVSLDTDEILLKAIDNVLAKAGVDEEITTLLVTFALQKTEEDKSWDIALDLYKAAKLLTVENELPFLEKLKPKSISDFKELESTLVKKVLQKEEFIQKEAQELLTKFSQEGLEKSHFSGGYSYQFFVKISEGDFSPNFNLTWQENLGIKPLYKKDEDPFIKEKMDGLTPQIISSFQKIKDGVFETWLDRNILKNLIPLATVTLINQEIELLKEEEAILPINEFNQIISKEIKNEPTPYIYERLGDRYRHFFIDEFQDTSFLQWQNLKPLAENALSQQYGVDANGSLLVVGDAKQSIYRWRGGLPEQFIDLCQTNNPFPSVAKEVISLEYNYRSCKEIVHFNNRFFSFIAPFFGNDSYQKIYKEGNQQKFRKDCEGYVSLQFIDSVVKEEAYAVYVEKVLDIISDLEQRGCPKKDICILTRKKEEGVTVSEFLVENNIAVVSEETLLYQNSEVIQCLINLLQLSLFQKEDAIKIKVLEFLYTHLEISEEKHAFFSEQMGAPLSKLQEKLSSFSLQIDFCALKSLGLYESFEYFIYALQLSKKADAFVMSFMDWVFQYSQKPNSGKLEFLAYWETKKEKQSLTLHASQEDAITVMTIHKSKGLEFPVVIFPFADLDLYYEKDPKLWYPWGKNGFEEVLINYSLQVENYAPYGKQMVQERRNTLELDAINLLYVAFTRAEKELYVLMKNESFKNAPKQYNHFLKLFLENERHWDETQDIYSFGEKTLWAKEKAETEKNAVAIPYHVSLPFKSLLKIAAKEPSFFNAETQNAIHFGNLVHDSMAKIFTTEDVAWVIKELKDATIDSAYLQHIENTLKNITNHPDLKALFLNKDTVFNEKEIISPSGIIRPDRINIHPDNSITLLDYKTGSENPAHNQQINGYAAVLQDMGYTIKEKLLVYVQKEAISINKIYL